MNYLIRFGLTSVVLSLSACGTLDGDKINYRSAIKAPTLEVPPDLTQLSKDNRYVVPGTAISAASYQGTQTSNLAQPIALRTAGDVRIERSGNQQWLVVTRPPEQLWDITRDFWQQSGFVLTMDQAMLGIMETDWAENRAKIPQDFIRSTLGKVLDALYSTGEQDKFRTRFERNANGGTDIFISHRGMIEVYTSNNRDRTTWQQRPADTELESEFLKRLMLKLTGSSDTTKTAVVAQTVNSTSRVTTANNLPVVQMDEGFDRAWRRVGLSLDRTGFTVEDRDRAKGTYFVRYIDPGVKKEEPGFFAKLLSGNSGVSAPLKLRVVLSSTAQSTTVSVQNADGLPEGSQIAQRIVTVIADDLK